MYKSIFKIMLTLLFAILLLSVTSCNSSGSDSDKPSDEETMVFAEMFSVIDDIIEGYLEEGAGLSIAPDLPVEEGWEAYVSALVGNTYTITATDYDYDDEAIINGKIVLSVTDFTDDILSLSGTITNLRIADYDDNSWVINSSGITLKIDTWEEEFVSGSGKATINGNEYSVSDIYDAIVELYY
ncbi:MAG: hypothetical protein RBT69_05250 [Spirochaetia bacterium]|jgi:hypothetical protein|nr:hypothetical protein [Spirochaetia bacterium]